MCDDESPEDRNTRLAMALLDGRLDALEEIARRFGPEISRILHRRFVTRLRLLKAEDIEDLLSIALHRIWEARANYNDAKQSLRAWFYCIAVNAAKDLLKLGWQKTLRLERNPGSDWLDGQVDSRIPEPPGLAAPDRVSIAKETRARAKLAADLQAVLSRISNDQRTIVLADLASRDGKASTEFLADELGIPAAHVRVYRQRGYEYLRREMKKLGHDIPEPRKTR